jgi:uncharacterized protein (DUF433 family)
MGQQDDGQGLNSRNGIAVFAGTDVPVQDFLDHLTEGRTLPDFIAAHPAVSRTQAVEVLQGAKRLPASAAPGKKDIWDKLGALSTLVAGVLIGGLGLIATSNFDEKQINLQERKAASDYKIARVQQLTNLYPYLSSDDPQKRQFGYNLIGALDFAEVGLNLARIKNNDAAAGQLVHSSLGSSDPKVAATALDLADSARFTNWIWPNARTAPDGSLVDFDGHPAVPNKANVAVLKSWMVQNGLGSLSIAVFLNSSSLASARKQAISALGIP